MNSKQPSFKKAEDPAGYAKLANEGMMLGYPVKIAGASHRPDNNIGYHSTIKEFNKEKDHPHAVHELAQHLPLHSPDAKNTQIKFDTFKSRLGDDVHVISLHGNSADKMKEHNGKFAHMGHPSKFEWNPHISVDKATWDKVKASNAKTAHEAGIEFGPAELKRGPQTVKTYHHEPDSAEPRVPDEGDITAKIKPPVEKAENTLGQKPLMKPFLSEAQRRWGHTSSGKEALGGNAGVHEWDEATKGKKLPERVSKSENGEKKYHIHVNGKKITDNPLTMKGIKDLTGKFPKDLEKDPNTKIIPHHGLITKSNALEKGALKTAGMALGIAGALAGASNQASPATQINRAPASIQKPVAPTYDHAKMLRAISQVESSGGKNTQHGVGGGAIHGSERAYGRFGLMPETIRETIKGHKDLQSKHGKALALKGDQLHRYMADNKGLEDVIADRHLSHMEHRLGTDPSTLGYGWLNGLQGTLNARKSGADIKNHWHAKKVSDAYGKGK